jgi:putative ABC transport system permease protein
LRQAQSVVVDANFIQLMLAFRGQRLGLGDVFEMNDRRALIVGIATVAQGQGGASYIFTTWDRARDYAPTQRRTLTHVLAAPMAGWNAESLARAITRQTGLQAITESQFKTMSAWWMIRNSPIPYVVGLIVGIGFVIGIGVSGQTFYTFVLENSRHLGALKAMGASNFALARLILVQAAIVGFVGFGVGSGVMSTFFSILPEGRAPLKLLWQIPPLVFVAITLICLAAAIISVVRVARIEPAIVFRS